jgi:hypothetical protein
MRRSAAKQNPERLSNGQLMRIAPLAVARFSLDPVVDAALAQRFCAQECALTHPNPVAVDAGCVFVAALRSAIAGAAPSDVYAVALAHAATEPVRASIRNARLAPQSAEFPADGTKAGYLGVALQNAFYHLLRMTTFERAIVDTVRLGGDTDTNCAIVGALLGACVGASGIPRVWRNAVILASSPSRAAASPPPPPPSLPRSRDTPESKPANPESEFDSPSHPVGLLRWPASEHRTVAYPLAACAGSCRSLAASLRGLAPSDPAPRPEPNEHTRGERRRR